MWKKIKPYVVSILFAVAVGALSGFLTKGSMSAYDAVSKPPLTPPDYIFPIVWTILFVLMGISAAIIYQSGDLRSSRALQVYGLQLAVNFFWSIIFFNAQAYLFAFLWLILLWILIVVMIFMFFRINKIAGLLQIPYLIWVTFAGYLNFMIWMLNR